MAEPDGSKKSESLQKKLEEFKKKKVQAIDSAKQDWARQLEFVKKEHQDAMQALKENHASVEAQLQKEIQDLKAALEDQRTALATLETEKESNSQLRLDIKTLQKEQEKEMELQRKAVSTLEDDLQKERTLKEKTECTGCTDLAQLQQAYQKSQEENKCAQSDIETTREERRQAKESLGTLQAQYEALQATSIHERKDLETQLKSAQDKIQSDGESLAEHQLQLRGLEAQQSKDAEALAKTAIELEEQIKRLNGQLSHEQQTNKSQKEELSNVYKTVEQLKKALEKEQSVSKREEPSAELPVAQESDGEVAKLQDRIKALEAENRVPRQDKRQLDEMKRLLDNSRTEITQLKSHLSSANDQIQRQAQDFEQRFEAMSSSESPIVDSTQFEKINAEKEELERKLERQFDAFTTIRGELTIVRDRELATEKRLTEEKTRIESELLRMEKKFVDLKNAHEDAKSLQERTDKALARAQGKLYNHGYSPVSEYLGSDYLDSGEEGDFDEHGAEEEAEIPSAPLIPDIGRRPPLEKPGFCEFLETPECSGCLSDVIEI